MNKLAKDNFYDDICHLLTDYENGNDIPVTADDLYDMLVNIVNNWEFLTGED